MTIFATLVCMHCTFDCTFLRIRGSWQLGMEIFLVFISCLFFSVFFVHKSAYALNLTVDENLKEVHSMTLASYCYNGCTSEELHIVRLDEGFPEGALPRHYRVFLIKIRDPDFCGSRGCASTIAVWMPQGMATLYESYGLTPERAEMIAIAKLREYSDSVAHKFGAAPAYMQLVILLFLALVMFVLYQNISRDMSFAKKIIVATIASTISSIFVYALGLSSTINVFVIPLAAGLSFALVLLLF